MRSLFSYLLAILTLLTISGFIWVKVDAPPEAPPQINNSPSGDVLFVVGNTSLTQNDQYIKDFIESIGYNVIIESAGSTNTGDATNKKFVFISPSAASGNPLGSTLKDVQVPILSCAPPTFGSMQMTGTSLGNDYGQLNRQSTNIEINNHILSADLSGSINVTSQSLEIGFGVPSESALKIASLDVGNGKYAIFSYETGATMVGMNAPARRMGFFLYTQSVEKLTKNGWKLLEAAIRWTANEDLPVASGSNGFVRKYGASTDSHYGVTELDNGKIGIIGSGPASGNAPYRWDYHYIRLQANGNSDNMSKRYETTNLKEDSQQRGSYNIFAQASNGDFVAAIEENYNDDYSGPGDPAGDSDTKPTYLRIDPSSGTVQQYFRLVNGGVVPTAMTAADNGDMLLANSSFGFGNGASALFMRIRDDSTSTLSWTKSKYASGVRPMDWEWINSTQSWVLARFYNGSSVDNELVLLEINPDNGNPGTHQYYDPNGGFDKVIGRGLVKLNNGNLVAVGQLSNGSDYHGFWQIFNSNGTTQNDKGRSFRLNTEGTIAYNVAATSDGGFVVVGASGTNFTGSGLNTFPFLSKYDANGNHQWSRQYEIEMSGYPDYSIFYHVTQTNDGGYLLGGGKFAAGSNTYPGLVLKTDDEGFLPNDQKCRVFTKLPILSSLTFSSISTTISVIDHPAGNTSLEDFKSSIGNVSDGNWPIQNAPNCNDSNLPPVAIITYETPNGLTVQFDGGASYDPEGEPLASYQWTFGDGNSDTGITPSHTYGSSGTYQVSLTVTDSDNQTDQTTVNVTLNAPPTNGPPVIADIADQTDETGTSANLTASATDPDGDNLTFTATGLPPGISISSNGVMSGTHTAAGGTSHFVTVTVSDGNGGSDSETFTWNITQPSSPGTEQIWLEAECVALAAGWTEGNQNPNASGTYYYPPTITQLGTPAGGSSNYLTYTFDVTEGGTYKIFFRVNVNGENLATATDHDSYWVRVDGGSWIKFNEIIDNNTQFEWAQIHDSDQGSALQTFSLGVGQHTLDVHLRETWAELDKIYITNSTIDPTGTGAVASNCTGNNNPPQLDPIADQTNTVGDAANVGVTASDPDGDNLSYTANGLPAGITINAGSGTMSGTITAAVGTYQVSVTVTDDGNPAKSDTEIFNWIVQQSGPAGTEEIWLEAECRQLANNWANGSSSQASNGQYVYPTTGQSNIQAPPTTNDYIRFPFTVSEGGLYTFHARVDVLDGSHDSFWVRLSTDNQWIKWNMIPNDGSNFVWAQVFDSDNGDALVTAQLSPGTYDLDFHLREPDVKLDKVYITNTNNTPANSDFGASDPTCVAGNNPPVLDPIADRTDTEGATASISTNATDPDGDNIIFTASGLPSGISIDALTGLISGTLTASTGTYQVTVTATDDGTPNLSDTESFTWTVTGSVPSTEEVWLEAECATFGNQWSIANHSGASGGDFLQTDQGDNIASGSVTAAHQISVDYTASSNGTYALWIRVRADWEYNSIWLLENSTWVKYEFNNQSTYNTWDWYQLPDQNLTAGSHTLTFAKREGGDIDKFVLSNDPAFTPSGQGTVGTNCGITNAPPVAVISPADTTGEAPFTVTFDGSGSTDDNGIVNYEWSAETNTQSGASAVNFTHTFSTAGTYTVSLIVSDAEGLTSTASATVTVNPPAVNQPPVAIIDPDDFIGSAPTQLLFDGSQSYDDKGIVRYEWELAGSTQGNTDTLIDPMDIKMSTGFPLADTFTIYLTVWDEEGLTGKDSSVIYLDQATEIPTGEILYVVGNSSTLSAGDQTIRDRLVNDLGYTVFVRDDNAYTPADLDGKILVIISSTVSSGVVGSQFTNVDLPLINYEEAISDELKMVGTDTDAARDGGENTIQIIDEDHFMASGLTGLPAVYNYGTDLTYGIPNANAYLVASLDTDPTKATIFGYEEGSLMFDNLAAPARRVGFFLYGDTPNALNANGWQLFEDAVCWALGCDLFTNICKTSPLPQTGYTPPAANASPSADQNYVRSTTFRGEGGTNPVHGIGYFDGLGRNILSIDVQGSPLGNDVRTPVTYDEIGRQAIQQLPIALGNGGGYSDIPGSVFYNIGRFPYIPQADLLVSYSTTEFEASPLNRVVKQTGPGAASLWGGSHIETQYQADGEYYLIRVTDENNSVTETRTDKLGRTVSKSTMVEGTPSTTHFEYNDFGNVQYVIQPMGSGTASTASGFTFEYEYDYRQRVTKKWIPGTDNWTEIFYDGLDRVIATKDPNGIIIATEYDPFGRPLRTGYGGTDGSIATPLSETSYDTYPAGAAGFAPAAPPALGQTALLAPQKTDKIKGLVTAVKVKILGTGTWLNTVTYYDDYGREIQTIADNHTGGQDKVTNFYNFAGDLLATVLEHNDGRGTTVTVEKAFDYDHRGRLLRITQAVDGGIPEIIGQYAYNELGQLQGKRLSANSCEDQLQLVDYTYNIRGWMTGINLVDKGNGLFDLDLPCPQAGVSQDLFAMKLNYNDGFDKINGVGDPMYNGNISGLQWQSAVQPLNTNLSACQKRGYGFTYDELNRLKIAKYAAGTSYTEEVDNFNVSLDYDLNGNITTLNRQGLIGTNSYGAMDALGYTYTGNRLTGISEGAVSTAVGEWEDQFIGGSRSYEYDANGNITSDGQKTLAYNHLNKPNSITLPGGTITYKYAADGTKLQMISPEGTYDYIGGFFYKDDVLQHFSHEEGRVFNNAGEFRYEYNITDHLGNVRVSFTDLNTDGVIDTDPAVGEVLQEDHYYPFGLRLGGLSNSSGVVNRYRYNGKELQDELGLGWYDYGARMYDPAVGRWNGIDALAEDFLPWSPYNYVYNNPLNMIDPDGNSAVATIDKEHKTIVVSAHIYFYGGQASEYGKKAAEAIQKDWNSAKASLTIGGEEYSVTFNITHEIVSNKKAAELAEGNTDTKNNFIRIESRKNLVKGTKSKMGIARNTGLFIAEDIEDNVHTAAHEFGHGLGWQDLTQKIKNNENGLHDALGFLEEDGSRRPGIMSPRRVPANAPQLVNPDNTPFADKYTINIFGRKIVDPKYRMVTQRDINKLNIVKKFSKSRGKPINLGITSNDLRTYSRLIRRR